MKPTPQAIENAARAILREMGDRRLLNDVDDDLHDEIGQSLALAAVGDLGDMVLVPREATAEMYAAWMCDHRDWSARYRAMIAAAEGEPCK